MTFLRLVVLFVLRNIREEKFLTFLSIIGVALGIGLFVGVKVASDRAVASFEAEMRGTTQHANFEILDTAGVDFNEEIYPRVRRIEENSFPVLKVNGYLPAMKESASIEGIYTAKAAGLLTSSGKMAFDIRDFYRTLNGVVITRRFARTHGIGKGSMLDALVYDEAFPLKIVGVIENEYLPANAVIMDLGNFQEYFHKVGLLSAIDLKTNEKTAEAIRKILPSNLTIEEREEIIRNRESVLKSFRYNLQFVSLIAILVGVFLLYNTVFISVVKRRTEIGILRGLGTTGKTVVMLFVVQGLLLGIAGSLFGIILGQAAAYFSVVAVERTVSAIYSAISVQDYLITKGDALLALALGVAVSLAASAVPAYESSRVRPTESAREGSFEGKYRKYTGLFAQLGTVLLATGGILSWYDYRYTPHDFPFLAYTGILLIIIGFSLISPLYLAKLLRFADRAAGRIFKVTGKIAVGDMSGNIYRFSVALMSVAISSALIIALLTLIISFRGSLMRWINRNIAADVYIKPSSCISNFCYYPLSKDLVKTIEGFPGVAGVDRFRTLYVDFHGRKVVAGFGDTAVQREFAHEKEEAGVRATGAGKEVGISTFLSTKYGLKRGDTIELSTPAGQETFVVRDTFSSYSTTSGFIYMDRKWLKRLWGLDDSTQLGLYLKKGIDADTFIRKLEERLAPRYSLDIMNNRELRERVVSIFDRTFAITYAIEFISIVVSLIGVVNTLLTIVLERKREISIIRYLGASWRQIQATLVISAGIVGIAGILLGVVMGLLLSVIFITVINKVSFGWEIHFHLPVFSLGIVTIVLLATTLFAGLIPARVARRIDPKRFASFE
jgi:putative ABC transport system permease protein